METATKKLYESMFLVDSGQAAADWDGTQAAINGILKRADAEVVCFRKWGDRKLAYEIDHKSRGTYILCYFRCESSRITGIERDVQLSEKVMRVLILSTYKRPPELIEKDIAGIPAELPKMEESAQGTKEVSPAKPEDSASEPEGAEQENLPEDTNSEAEPIEPVENKK